MMSFIFENWGLVDYQQALEKQESYVEEINEGQRRNTIVFCTHNPVVTLGRGTQEGDVFAWDGPTIQVSRGGRATYHGPSQVVVYPIVSIKEGRKKSGPNDVGAFLRDFEKAIILTLSDLGISAQGKSYQQRPRAEKATEETGVWVQNQKIASLGLAVRHWITFHGAAINIKKDRSAFLGIKPCGFQSSIMTSVEELLGFLPEPKFILERLEYRIEQEISDFF
jgi:lipoyl(octanoyl) transferase